MARHDLCKTVQCYVMLQLTRWWGRQISVKKRDYKIEFVPCHRDGASIELQVLCNTMGGGES